MAHTIIHPSTGEPPCLVPDPTHTSEARPFLLENVSVDAGRAYQAIADDPKYKHFVRIPNRILQCIDYFGIACDRVATRTRLHAYYLSRLFLQAILDNVRDRFRAERSFPQPSFVSERKEGAASVA